MLRPSPTLLRRGLAGLLLVLLPLGATLAARPVELPGRSVEFHADSAGTIGSGGVMEPIWETIAGEEGALWIRLFFSPETRLRHGSRVRLTSMLDGAVQHLDADTLRHWGDTSAYFNGSQVLVELLSGRGGGSRVVIDGLWAGVAHGPVETICGSDDRVLSSDARDGRMVAGGCTGWLINECFLSAGHCMLGNSVIQFNVPLSSASGALNHPPPSDQYSIDTASRQFMDGGVGNDWGYFGAFPNTETGLTPLEAQGVRHALATEIPGVSGQSIRITGYGVDSTPPDYTQVQQTNAGPYREFSGTVVRYETDTTGGNSGSAVVDESTGRAIGIHTHAGCDSSPPPYNQGTALSHAGLQQALRNPQGLCATQPACDQDGICEAGEDCFNCVTDCGHAPPGGGGGGTCGNNICEIGDGEDCFSCPADCNGATTGRPSSRYCCGDTVTCGDARCTGGGNTCNPVPTGGSNAGYCCGDGTCEGAEDSASCGVDCSTGCTIAADCNDSNECTIDSCNAGSCEHAAQPDGASCDAGSGLCCTGSCAAATCSGDSDCNDGDICTGDLCINPGTCSASCDNPPTGGCCVATHSKEKGPRCSDGLDNDCDGFIDAADSDC